jgi:hypothetical protein
MKARHAVLATNVLLAVALQAAYAVPAHAIAVLRAKVCCTYHCPKQRVQAVPGRCCEITPAADDRTLISRGNGIREPHGTGIAAPVSHDTGWPVHTSVARASRPVPLARGSPIFIWDRVLRL